MLEETVNDDSAPATALSRKATLLIAEILQMSNRVLPLTLAAKIQVSGLDFPCVPSADATLQALPRVFNMASDYQQGINRIVGTSTLLAMWNSLA